MFKLVPTIHSFDGHYLMFINKQTQKKKTDVHCSEVSITLYDQVHLPVSRQGYCDLKHMEKNSRLEACHGLTLHVCQQLRWWCLVQACYE